jgi:serine/threonine protein kinase
MSEPAKNLISRLCYPKQMQRFSAKEALRHPWITRKLEEPLPLNEYEKG